MAKISLVLTVALSVALATANPFVSQNSGIVIKLDEPHIKYYMAIIRGFSDGYGRGLYSNESEVTSKDCLGESTYKNIMDFNRFLTSGDFVTMFKSVGKIGRAHV